MLKSILFPDEVYVFTPKGQIIELPAGATAVDFAYAIHSDIGSTCVAAKLDRRLAPLSTVLDKRSASGSDHGTQCKTKSCLVKFRGHW